MSTGKRRELSNDRGVAATEYSLLLSLLCFAALAGTTQIGSSSQETFYTVGCALEGCSTGIEMLSGGSGSPVPSGGGSEQEFEVSAEDGIDPSGGHSAATPIGLPLE